MFLENIMVFLSGNAIFFHMHSLHDGKRIFIYGLVCMRLFIFVPALDGNVVDAHRTESVNKCAS